jgi:hypothetical protein
LCSLSGMCFLLELCFLTRMCSPMMCSSIGEHILIANILAVERMSSIEQS